MLSHTSPSKRVSTIFHKWFVFFFKLDTVNVDVPFWKRGHNLEMEAKLKKARHAFLNEVSLNVGAISQLIPSKGAHKRTKMCTHICCFILRKRQKTFHEISMITVGVKIPSALANVSMGQFTTTMACDNLK